MFKIGKECHLLHVVNDLDTAGMTTSLPCVDLSEIRCKAAMRQASLVLIADFVMEPAQPLRHYAGVGEISSG